MSPPSAGRCESRCHRPPSAERRDVTDIRRETRVAMSPPSAGRRDVTAVRRETRVAMSPPFAGRRDVTAVRRDSFIVPSAVACNSVTAVRWHQPAPA